MARRLTDNLTSMYIGAANRLKSKQNRHKVIAYVESYDDIFFWRDVLSAYENEHVCFEIMLPSKSNLSRGKKTALMNRLGENLGTNMIACVDADYDYLLQGTSPMSRFMLDSPYVFHTYVYSIENYQCYAPTLHNVCVMSTLNDRDIFDFEGYLRLYSEIIYDLFVWTVWLYRHGRNKEFPLMTFCNFITIHHVNTFHPERALESVRQAVNHKMAWMQRHYPQAKGELKPLKAELETLGVRPDNTYLFIQGHHLMDNVVMPVMESVCTQLRREREKEIKRLAEHTQQMDNELSSYQHSQCPVESMIRRNTGFKSSEPYKRLAADIEAFLDDIKNEYMGKSNDKAEDNNNILD